LSAYCLKTEAETASET